MSDSLTYEKKLLEQIARGEESAFRTIFDRHWDRLYHYLLAITKSRQIAEEIAADVFLKLWIGRELLPEIHYLEAFLLRVARNKAIDFLEEVARNTRYQKLIFETIRQPNMPAADDQLLNKESQGLLAEVLDTLSPRRRLVFTLHRIEGMSHKEIAEQLNLSHQTVKNTMADAQRAIRSVFKRKFPDGFFLLIASCSLTWFS